MRCCDESECARISGDAFAIRCEELAGLLGELTFTVHIRQRDRRRFAMRLLFRERLSGRHGRSQEKTVYFAHIRVNISVGFGE